MNWAYLWIVPLCYMAIAMMVFEFRNPTANRAAVISHMDAVLTFQVLPQFQEYHQ